jgi:hypothetical protein
MSRLWRKLSFEVTPQTLPHSSQPRQYELSGKVAELPQVAACLLRMPLNPRSDSKSRATSNAHPPFFCQTRSSCGMFE